MNFFAYDRFGGAIPRPSVEEREELLRSLSASDLEHSNVSVQTETGWCISAFASGLVVFENVETGDGPWHLESQHPGQVLELWARLVSDDLSSVRAAPWVDGYGPNA